MVVVPLAIQPKTSHKVLVRRLEMTKQLRHLFLKNGD
jgi:hypothetical protein